MTRAALGELGSVLAALGDLVLPAACAGCGGEGPGAAPLCPPCASTLSAPARLRWPTPCPPDLPPPWSVAPYRGPVRAALLAHKEDGRAALADPLGAALGRAVLAAAGAMLASPVHPAPILLVPVPSGRAATRRRGGDPMRRLTGRAAALARRAGVPVAVSPVLCQARRPADQAGLSTPERFANLAGALTVRKARRPRLDGAAVVVLDDVVTTGATLVEAARVLTSEGAHVLGAAVVAATARREGPWWPPNREGTSVSSWHPSGSVVAPSAPATREPLPASRCQPQAKRPT